uniref:Ribosomal protein S14 n=1 Tax=Trichogramma kaykai TaxID=54128 RepID=A0ABD2WT87_9HYME
MEAPITITGYIHHLVEFGKSIIMVRANEPAIEFPQSERKKNLSDGRSKTIIYQINNRQSNLTKPFRRPLVSPIIHEKYTARVLCCTVLHMHDGRVVSRACETIGLRACANCKGLRRRGAVIGSEKLSRF